MGKLPQNVADAVAEVDAWLSGESVHADWVQVRAHLMSQEAEIARLREENIKLHGWLNAEAQAAGNTQYRLKKYESHLAAANALLREAIGWNWLDDDASRPDVMDVLDQAIQSHLQGAGDEA